MANGITLKVDSGPYIVTTAPANFYTDTGLSSAVTAPVTITSDTVWYCSAAVATAVPDVTIVATQLDGTTIFNGTIRVGQTTDTYLRPTPTLGMDAADLALAYVRSNSIVGQETAPRWACNSTATFSSGLQYFSYMTALRTESIGSIRYVGGATAAAATPTVVRFGLYTVGSNGTVTLVASTANDTTLFSVASTAYTKALSTPYTVTAGIRYAVSAIVVTGAAAPNVASCALGSSADAGWGRATPVLCSVTSGLSDLAASVVVGSLAASAAFPYAALIPA